MYSSATSPKNWASLLGTFGNTMTFDIPTRRQFNRGDLTSPNLTSGLTALVSPAKRLPFMFCRSLVA